MRQHIPRTQIRTRKKRTLTPLRTASLLQEKCTGTQAQDRSTAMIGKPVVLRVDDTLSVLEGRQVLLEENGYEVLTATGGKEVVQLFVSTPPSALGRRLHFQVRAHNQLLGKSGLPAESTSFISASRNFGN